MSRKRRSTPQPESQPSASVRRVSAVALAPSEWGVASGYGRAAFSIAKALQKLGVNVEVIGRPKIVGDAPEFKPAEKLESFEAIIHLGDPPNWKTIPKMRNVGFTWWPFSQMPTEWHRPLYAVESLIVPSAWCASGAIMPRENQAVHVAPLGVDASFEPYRRERGDTLRLLFFDGDAGAYRSGGDIAVAAFRDAFPDERREDVRLDIWSTQACDLSAPDPRIQIHRHIGTDGDLVRFYRRYDALLATARGTGFGLIPREAMATGMPVLHCGQGALEDIADLGVLVGARKRPTLSQAHASAECFEPLYEICGRQIRSIDTSYDQHQAEAARDAIAVALRFTWENTAQAILKALS